MANDLGEPNDVYELTFVFREDGRLQQAVQRCSAYHFGASADASCGVLTMHRIAANDQLLHVMICTAVIKVEAEVLVAREVAEAQVEKNQNAANGGPTVQ